MGSGLVGRNGIETWGLGMCIADIKEREFYFKKMMVFEGKDRIHTASSTTYKYNEDESITQHMYLHMCALNHIQVTQAESSLSLVVQLLLSNTGY